MDISSNLCSVEVVLLYSLEVRIRTKFNRIFALPGNKEEKRETIYLPDYFFNHTKVAVFFLGIVKRVNSLKSYPLFYNFGLIHLQWLLSRGTTTFLFLYPTLLILNCVLPLRASTVFIFDLLLKFS